MVLNRIAVLLAALLAATSSLTSPLHAQEPVPNNLLDQQRLLPDNTFNVCINANGLLADFDRSVAAAIAERLLLDVQFHDASTARDVLPLDYRLPFLWEEIYIYLENDCDAFMGVVTGGRGYPEWLVLSRAYVGTEFAFVTRNEAYSTFADIPPGSLVGARMSSGADIAFRTYNNTLPKGEQVQRSPYPYDKLLVDRLIDGTLAAAFVWEPTLYAATGGAPEAAGIHVLDDGPFITSPSLEFGIALQSVNNYLRLSVDQAIVAMVEDGTIATLAGASKLPLHPPAME